MKSVREQEIDPATVAAPEAPTATVALPTPSAPLTAARIAALQRYAGNAAVARLIDSQRQANAAVPEAPAPAGDSPASAKAPDAASAGGAAAGAAGPAEAQAGAAAGAAAAGPVAPASAGAAAGAAGPIEALGGAAAGGAAAGPAVDAPAAGGAAAGGAAAGAAGAGPVSDSAAAGGAAGAAGAAAAGPAAVGGAAGAAAAGPVSDSAAAGGAAGAAGAAAAGPVAAGGAAAGGVAAGVAAAGPATAGGAAGAAAAGPVADSAAAGGAAGAAGAAAGPATAGGAAGAAAAGPAAAPAAGGAAAGAGAAGPAAAGAGAAGGAAAGKAGAAATGGAAAGKAGPAAASASGGAAAAGGAGAAAAGPAAAGAAGAAAAPPIIKDPHADPAFKAMKGQAVAAGGGAKAHAPPKAGAAAAQAAALPPANDVSSQAAAAQVDEMAQQEPGVFDRAAFIAAVRQAIDAAAPKNLEEADEFDADGVKGQVGGLVKDGKQDSEKDIKDATVAAPDPSAAKPKPVTPMQPEPVGAAAASVGGAAAMPDPVHPAHTDLSAGPAQVDAKMAEANVTDEQVAKSNEPEFKSALGARDAAAEHSVQAPGDYRKAEQGVLGKATGDAAGVEAAGLGQMQGARGQAFAKALGHKEGAKGKDEAKRAKVASDIQAIYDRTKSDVSKTLDGLDGKVEAAFSQGEAAARKAFESYVDARMDAFKEERYSGILGPAAWLKDKLLGMPSEVNAFYSEARTHYLAEMDAVIGRVADIVGGGLTTARARIAQGKAEIQKYVAQLPEDLKQVGQEAEEKLASQFEQLTADVDAKQSDLVDNLARKYVEARDALDSRIDEMKAANRGLVDKALDAVGGVIKTIIQLKNMLLGVLAKAADVIGDIIADPIGFLGKLIDGIKAGLSRFVGNIAHHLQEGLMGWLFGALGRAGITLPKTLDLAGIFDLVLQVLGLTYAKIRQRAVKAVGEPVVARLEQTVEIFKVLMTEGISGLWRFVKDKIGDLEELVLGQIKTFIIEKVIKAGITWLIAFLNPAAAFIKACKAIYDIVMFLIERGSEIMDFVRSILDSVGAIAKGAIGIVAEKVEGSLAKALPLAISFLASLLGLGGISDKIRSVIEKVQAPVTKAVDFVIGGVLKGAKKLFGGAAGFVKDKYQAGKQYVKGKATAAKEWVGEKAGMLGDWLREKLGLVEVKEDFDMQGASHEVVAHGAEDGVEITMASAVATSLSPLVKRALAKMRTSRNPKKAEIISLLTAIDQDLGDASSTWRQRVRTIKAMVSARARTDDEKVIEARALAEMTGAEKALAADVKKIVAKIRRIPATGIQELLDEIGGRRMFPPTIINSEGRFRDLLYDRPASWGTTRANFIGSERQRLTDKIIELDDVGARKAEGKRVPKPEYDKAYRDVETMESLWSGNPNVARRIVAGGRLDPGAVAAFEAGRLLKYYQKMVYHVDHIVPLARHWKETGYKSDDAERGRHAGKGNPGNLQMLTEQHNTSKGSKDEDGDHRFTEMPYVEEPFATGSEHLPPEIFIQVEK